MTDDKYPTLHALGLGPALDEVERVCAIGAAGKYAGQQIDPRLGLHMDHALDHITVARSTALQGRDIETNEREIAHAAARLLMAMATSHAEADGHGGEPC
jgi:hypothetical protein